MRIRRAYPLSECITIDFKSRRVQVRGQSIALAKTEYELLALFVSFPGEVLSREVIRKQIWRDSELYMHRRTVDVRVQHLRKKPESSPDSPSF